jgi:lysophospholipase L1-like esterase
VNRMGRVGDTTANLVGQDSSLNADAAGQVRQQTAYAKVGGPHLVIVGYGVNDYLGQNTTSSTLAQPGTTPTQYQANLQSFCNIAAGSGACVLIWCGLPTPSAPTPATYARSAYVAAAKAVATATDHVAAIDVAEITKDWATASVLGLQTVSSVNPTRRGHGLLARILRDVLTEQVVFG